MRVSCCIFSTVIFLTFYVYSQENKISAGWEQNRSEVIRILTQFGEVNSIPEFVHDDHKCGFWIYMRAADQWNNFTPDQKRRLKDLQAVRLSQRDTVIGKFRIYFDTTGFNEPALLDESNQRIPNTAYAYVDSVGKYLNYVWSYVRDSLGYDEPPFRYGNSVYPVSIEDLGTALYGETGYDPDIDLIGSYIPPRYTSFMRIDNDYHGFVQSPGLAGLKVTLAHELHHVYQIGSYGLRSPDIYFYEITSTWMEDVIFDEVNDYYQYLSNDSRIRSHFAYPDMGFVRANGSIEYSRCIWGKFIEKRFDRSVMLNSWIYFRNESTLRAIDHSLFDRGSSFRAAFTEWAVWNLNTGPDGDTVNYYSEGKKYPPILKRQTIVYSQIPRAFSDTIDAVSGCYRPVCVVMSPQDTCTQEVRMIVTVLNLDVMNAFSLSPCTFVYRMAPDGDANYRRLLNGLYVKLEVPDPENWVVHETIPAITSEVLVFPNPYSGGAFLNFRLPPVTNEFAELAVYSVSMDRIKSLELPVESVSYEPFIRWDAMDEGGYKIPSGVYIYIISVDGKQFTGKFAVIRD